MHKVSLQNYATGLPHQRGLEWHGPRPPPSAPFFGYAKKTYLKWEIPQEVASSWATPKDIVRY